MFLNAVGIVGAVGPPITGCSDVGSGNVSCSGTSVGAGASIDVYRANTDVPGAPQGDRWLCNTTSGGGGAWGCTFANPGGGSATATERLAPGNTSAFALAAGIPAGPAATATFTPAPTNTTAPAATNTPAPTATRTPTSAPGAATATRTPTTGAMESVSLAGSVCNPVASSYADDTAIATIAGAVSPSGILVSIWWFDSATLRWLGYDPLHPANPPSDLTSVDRLDAFFICVSATGTWSRPVI